MINPELENFKRRVKDACDIVQVISSYYPLTRKGRNFWACCPFHHEKTPSFSVNPEGQFFKCFGCGKGGDVFTFVMEAERVDFPQALALLAERAHIPMPEYRSKRSPEEVRLYEEGKNLLYRMNEYAARFFEAKLWSEEGAKARAYLERRGISRESAEKYRLGYAPDSWEALCGELRGRKAAPRHMVAAGLAVQRRDGEGVYDRFRNRLTFAIIEAAGRCVGFGARALSAEDNPKYLNSPETPVFSKGRLVFGLPQAREALGDDRQLLMTEGYTDVVMAAQKGFGNAVATLGTALTRDHLRLLRRFADTVLVVFDSDAAGQAAAERGLDLFFAEELPARVVTLEAGLDPCDYLSERGPAAFAERLEKSVDLFEFKLAAVRSQHDLETAHGRRAAVRALMETVAHATDPIMAAELRRRAAEAFGLPEEVLAAELAGRARPAAGRESRAFSPEGAPRKLTRRQKAERALAQALVAYPAGLDEAAEALGGFEKLSDPATAELLAAAQGTYRDLEELNLEELATKLTRPEAVALVAGFVSRSGGWDSSDPAGEFATVLKQIKKFSREEEVARLLEERRSAPAERQAAIMERVTELQTITSLEERLERLCDKLHRVAFDERRNIEGEIDRLREALEGLIRRPAGVSDAEFTEE